eukprot:682082-Rhodomonas_salina.1
MSMLSLAQRSALRSRFLGVAVAQMGRPPRLYRTAEPVRNGAQPPRRAPRVERALERALSSAEGRGRRPAPSPRPRATESPRGGADASALQF